MACGSPERVALRFRHTSPPFDIRLPGVAEVQPPAGTLHRAPLHVVG